MILENLRVPSMPKIMDAARKASCTPILPANIVFSASYFARALKG
jgi:hypothetical protein